MKECSYCGEFCVPTKEHIWPAGILQKSGSPDLALAPGGKRLFKGEPQINDVCAECNNVRLSSLDSYLKEAYEKHFSVKIPFRETITFNYKYDLLLRGLLKISYNSHRANNDRRQIGLFKELRSYILYGSDRPRSEVRLQIVTESKISVGGKEVGVYKLDQFRSVLLDLGSDSPAGIMTRLIAFNSYWFFVTVEPGYSSSSGFKKQIALLEGANSPSGIVLSRSKASIVIPWSKTTWVDPGLWGQQNMLESERPNKAVMDKPDPVGS